MSTSVYKLHSDKQFISKCSNNNDIIVLEYKGDPNDFGFSHTGDGSNWWYSSATVGPTSGSMFKALEVWGVTIEGDQFANLVKDLTLSESQTSFGFCVNRQGLCYLKIGSGPIKRLRISDRFGWSKYGVKVPQASTMAWSIYDLSNGAVLFDPRRGPDEEKEKEVVCLKAALKALTSLICDK